MVSEVYRLQSWDCRHTQPRQIDGLYGWSRFRTHHFYWFWWTIHCMILITIQYNTTEHLYRALTKTSFARERIMLYNENRWIFNLGLNWTTDVHWRTKAGRLFHSLGPETEKARLPNFRFMRITAKFGRVDDQNPLELLADHDVTKDACIL